MSSEKLEKCSQRLVQIDGTPRMSENERKKTSFSLGFKDVISQKRQALQQISQKIVRQFFLYLYIVVKFCLTSN